MKNGERKEKSKEKGGKACPVRDFEAGRVKNHPCTLKRKKKKEKTKGSRKREGGTRKSVVAPSRKEKKERGR